MAEASSQTSRHVRFGVTDGDRYSQYWKLTATPSRPELVIASNRTGSFMHLTMHEDPAFWHIKVTLPAGVTERPWDPPKEVLRGVRRLVRLILPIESVRHERPRGASRVVWYPAPLEKETWIDFTVLHCSQGRPRIRNADLLGGVRLADSSEALVVAAGVAAQPDSWTFWAPDPDEIRRTVAERQIGMFVVGVDEQDGCLAVLHLENTPRDVSPQ